MAAADLTTRPTCRAFANRVNSRSRSSTLLRPRNRLWSGLVAGHRDHLEVLVELDVVLPVLALGVIDFKAAAALGLAGDFQGSLDLLGLRRCHGCVSKREALLASAAAKAGGPADD